MISERQVVKCTLLSAFIVNFHVIVDGFLVRQMKVVFLMIGGAVGVTSDVFLFVIAIFSFYLGIHSSWRTVACCKRFRSTCIR